MYTETVLLESRSLRSGVSHRTEILDKVKTLALSPDGVHATTQDVAEYFEVSDKVVYNLLSRHRAELESNGLKILRGSDLREYETFKLKVSSGEGESYPQVRRNSLAVYTRRTVLNVAMLLRDSEVARRVRKYLLDAEEGSRADADEVASLSRRVTNVEAAVGDIGAVLQELGPVISRMSVRLERVDRRVEEMDRRLTGTGQVVAAMSHRLAEVDQVVRELRGDVNSAVRRRRLRRG